MGFYMRKGYVENPLLKQARNDLCACGSGAKFKKCCINKLPRGVTEELAKWMKGNSFFRQMEILQYAVEKERKKNE